MAALRSSLDVVRKPAVLGAQPVLPVLSFEQGVGKARAAISGQPTTGSQSELLRRRSAVQSLMRFVCRLPPGSDPQDGRMA